MENPFELASPSGEAPSEYIGKTPPCRAAGHETALARNVEAYQRIASDGD